MYSILHIDSEKSWRGGQQQVLYLLQGLQATALKNILVCPPASVLEKRARAANLSVVPVKMRGEWDLIAVRKLKKIVKENSVDIVHMHSSRAHSLGFWAVRDLDCKTIVSRRLDFHIRKNFYSKLKYRSVDKIIAVSQAVKDVLVSDGIDKEKIDVIHDSCDWKKYQNPNGEYLFSELNLDRRKSIVGIIAALAWHKDHENFLRAARIVKNRLPSVQFLIVGEGERLSKIKSLTKRLGLEADVKLLGFRKDIPQILSIFNVFVLSSSWEGLGSVLLEAMASHLPIVATKVGGIPEIIKDEENGFLVEPQQSDSLAEKIVLLLKNKTKAKQMAENGFHVVKEKFSVEKMVKGTIKVYEQLLKN